MYTWSTKSYGLVPDRGHNTGIAEAKIIVFSTSACAFRKVHSLRNRCSYAVNSIPIVIQFNIVLICFHLIFNIFFPLLLRGCEIGILSDLPLLQPQLDTLIEGDACLNCNNLAPHNILLKHLIMLVDV